MRQKIDIGDGYLLSLDQGEWLIYREGGDPEASGYYEITDDRNEVIDAAIKEWEGDKAQARGPASMTGVTFSLRLDPGVELAVTPHYGGGPYLIRKLPDDIRGRLDQAARNLLSGDYPVMKSEEAGGTCLLYSVMRGDFL